MKERLAVALAAVLVLMGVAACGPMPCDDYASASVTLADDDEECAD
jgi:hypothetical protein